ncbi:Rv3654c family TadE-like protein [Hamadaea tsunoensis]|uniref:Rv3654c family TadE-like protein n=1 Tax=Hamadaea tsunoensis TaxID=53368 RepID=UPI000403F50A|nr:Rv3654c family TadE-like protein [Hamadaea tsunoensis]
MRTTRGDRGSASVGVLGVGLALLGLCVPFALAGAASAGRHRAQVAADLSALAGAQRAIGGAAVACGRAAEFAAANGARLTACRLDGLDLVVTTEISTPAGWARGAARAGPVSDDGP